MQTPIYILLPVHNRKQITLDFVKNLLKQTVQDFRLILIDDGSKDGTSDEVKSLLPNVEIIRGNGNLWWAGSLQAGIKFLSSKNIAAKTPILIINDDTILPDNFLEIGIKELDNNPTTLVCANTFTGNHSQDSGVYINWPTFEVTASPSKEKTNCLPTRGLFLWFEDILHIGGFKPALLPHYLSDYEFTYRAYVKGYKLLCPQGLYLQPMLEATGIRDHGSSHGLKYLRKLFSIRCVGNPYYLFIFIMIAAPRVHILRATYMMMLYALKGVVNNVVLYYLSFGKNKELN